MTDIRELLELAAAATGRNAWDGWEYFDYYANAVRMRCVRDGKVVATWQPNTDDGDCARMEAQLLIAVEYPCRDSVCSHAATHWHLEPFANQGGDRNAARRLASLRVAAEIGRRIREAQG